MKDISATLKSLLTRDDIEPFILLEIGPNQSAQFFRYTTLPYDITFETNTYSSSNGLANLDPPRISRILDKESYNINFVDPQYTLKPFFEGGSGQLIGINMRLIGGFINSTDSLLFGTSPGQDFGEYFTLYKGFVDTANYSVTKDTVILNVEGSSPMGPLDLTRAILTSKEYVQRKYPTETGYDQLFVGSGAIRLNWGKEL